MSLKPSQVWISMSSEEESFIPSVEELEKALGNEIKLHRLIQPNRMMQFQHLYEIYQRDTEGNAMVVMCDDDDLVHPLRLEYIQQILKDNPELDYYESSLKSFYDTDDVSKNVEMIESTPNISVTMPADFGSSAYSRSVLKKFFESEYETQIQMFQGRLDVYLRLWVKLDQNKFLTYTDPRIGYYVRRNNSIKHSYDLKKGQSQLMTDNL